MTLRTVALAATALSALALGAQAQDDTIKIGYIDPLSGAFANVGDSGLKHFTYAAEKINEAGGSAGKNLEIVGFDNKTDPKESLVQFQKAVDQGIRYIAQGNGTFGRLGADRRGRQAQRPQPRRGDPVSQLCRGRSGLHQRSLQLLALPLRR